MRNALTILRRELSAYYTSPIGYIYMIVFVLVSVGLYITTFFTFPVADMRQFFSNLPIMLCVFIPAVTMRVWAEERKENTWEMLLTFPMKAWELVLGKFFACLVFFALTLLATITVPVMLASLGNPDNGAVFGGYLGTLLLGAFFLSIGIFFSGFFKDQIVAFVITALTCFAVFLVGTNFFASYIDATWSGLGSLLTQLVGVTAHYETFTRGVLEVGDLLYFIAWTVLFLLLNILYIDSRSRPYAKALYAGSVAVCLGIGLLFNWLTTETSLGRVDMTEDKIYTVSEASEAILARVKHPVQVKLYITPKDKMPTGLTTLEQDIAGKIEELQVASGGKLDFQTIHMEVANVLQDNKPEDEDGEEKEEDEEEAVEKRMLEKGVEPFSVRAVGEDEVTSKLIYSSIGVGYLNKEEEIIPQIMPQNLQELEYRLVSTVFKLTREKDPVVALVAPREPIRLDPQMKRMYAQMGQPLPQFDDPYEMLQLVLDSEKYDVRRVDLTQESPLPDEYDTLVVINPRDLNERQRWEINRAIRSGKSVFLAVQNYKWDYRPSAQGVNITRRDQEPGVADLLETYGLGINDDILMDESNVPLTIQTSRNPLEAMLGGGLTLDLSTHILVNNESMDHGTSITNRLSAIFYLWGSALTIDEDELKKHGLEHKVIMYSSDDAWTFPAADRMGGNDFEPPASGLQRYPLMVMATGQFPDAFAGEERPTWPIEQPMPGQPPPPPPPEEEPAEPIEPAPGKLALLGCSEMFQKSFLQQGNLDLFMNTVDAITLGDELVHVRSRKPIDRVITKPEPHERTLWKTVNYGLAPALLGIIGIATMLLRKQARNAYTVRYAARQDN